MSIATEIPTPISTNWNVANLLAHFDDIPPERIRLHPAPGTATLADLVRLEEQGARPCELIDGTLVEKSRRLLESVLAG